MAISRKIHKNRIISTVLARECVLYATNISSQYIHTNRTQPDVANKIIMRRQESSAELGLAAAYKNQAKLEAHRVHGSEMVGYIDYHKESNIIYIKGNNFSQHIKGLHI